MELGGSEPLERSWRQKKGRRRSSGVATDRGLSAPLPPGGGLPPTKEVQHKALPLAVDSTVPVANSATHESVLAYSASTGADTATPEPSVGGGSPPQLKAELQRADLAPAAVVAAARTAEAPATPLSAPPATASARLAAAPAAAAPAAAHGKMPAKSPMTTPRRTPRQVQLRPAEESKTDLSNGLGEDRGVPLPHDMLFGFVRTNSRDYQAADEQRWGDAAVLLVEEALKLLADVKAQRLADEAQLSRDQRIFDQFWPYQELGTDKSGHWAVLDRLGRADFDTLNRELSHNQVLQCYAQRMERVRRSKLKLAERAGNAAYYHTTVIDLRGLNSSFLRKDNRSFVQRTFKFSSTCYPETVYRIYIINCPSAFPLFWKIIRPWLDPETSIKIQVLSTKDAIPKIRERMGIDLAKL